MFQLLLSPLAVFLSLSTSIDGNDAADVQARLKVAVDKALQVVKPSAEEGKMDVSTGNFRLNPRYNSKDGKINGWNGYAEVVLEGTDFARITAAAGKVQWAISILGVCLHEPKFQHFLLLFKNRKSIFILD